MAQITWVTPEGNLGTYSENTQVVVLLEVDNPVTTPATFTLLSGSLPTGLTLSTTGTLSGTPQVDSIGNSVAREYRFAIRASNTANQIADRTFSLYINNIAPPIILNTGIRGEGVSAEFGNILLTFANRGLGYYSANVGVTIAAADTPGGELALPGKVYLFGNGAIKSIGLTRPGTGYSFAPNITITGGNTFAANASITSLTSDGLEDLGRWFDGDYVEIQILKQETSPTGTLQWAVMQGSLPPGLRISQTGLITGFAAAPPAPGDAGTGSYDVGRYDQYVWDFEGASDSRTYQFTIRIFDGINYAYQRYRIGIYAKSFFLVDNILITADSAFYTADRDGYQYPSITTVATDLPPVRQLQSYAFQFQAYYSNPANKVKWSVNAGGPARFDQGALPVPDDNNNVYTIVPFDGKSFDQTDLSLPGGLFIDLNTGWLIGKLGTTTSYESTYEFTVTAYVEVPISATAFSRRASQPVTFRLKVLSEVEDIITWATDTDLGSIDNGTVSTLKISASSRSGAALAYRVKSGQYLRIPQGLSILSNGLISGRTSFDDLTLDRNNSTVTYNPVTKVYDTLYTFTIIAENSDATIYSEKEFTLRVSNINDKPYENLYLKALLPAPLRQVFRSIVTDPNLASSDIIYRADDPYFGVHLDLTMLVQPGVNAETAATYIAAMSDYHYDKQVDFGTIRKAVARNIDGSVKYEVLYVDVLDYTTATEVGSQIRPSGVAQTIFSNSFPNMAYEIEQGVGYQFQGALPEWMLSVQPETGQPLGLVRGLVLAYANPGQGDKLLYRYRASLLQSGYAVTDIMNTFKFVADRYQWDRTLSINFDPDTGTFVASRATTFDLIPSTGTVDKGAWIAQSSGTGNNLQSVIYKSGTGFIAVGSGGTILSSTDGSSWFPEGQSIDFGFTLGSLYNLTSGDNRLSFAYTDKIAVGDEVLPTAEFVTGARSYVTSIQNSIRLSTGVANAIPAGTTLQFISWTNGGFIDANVTSSVTANVREIYLDNVGSIEPGYGMVVKGIDIGNVTVVTGNVGTQLTLSYPTTNLIPSGTNVTFDDLRGNVYILTTNAAASAGATSLSFATIGNVRANYYPRLTAINSGTSVLTRFTYANISESVTDSIVSGTELDFTHRITANASAGSTLLNLSNTSQLTVGAEVYPVVAAADDPDVTWNFISNVTFGNATVLDRFALGNVYAAVTNSNVFTYQTGMTILTPSNLVPHTLAVGQAIAGANIPSTAVVANISSNVTLGLSNIYVTFSSTNVAATANSTITFTSTTTELYVSTALSSINGEVFRGMGVIGPNLPLSSTVSEFVDDGVTANISIKFADPVTVSGVSNVALAFYTPALVTTGTTIIGKTDTSITLSDPLLEDFVVGADRLLGYSLTSVVLNHVTYSDEQWIAVGDRGLIITKQNNTKIWTQRFGLLYGDLKAIGSRSYASGTSTLYTYIAIGNEGTIIRSTDGDSWSLPIVSLANRTLRGVAYADGAWIAVGDGGQIITSTDDGLTWTLDNTTTTLNLGDVGYFNNQWIVVGDKGYVWLKENIADPWIRYSTGVTDNMKSVAYVNNAYLVVGARGAIVNSLDGTSWRAADRFTTSKLNSVSRGSVTPVVIGDSGVILRESPGFTVDWAIRNIPFDQFNYVPRLQIELAGYDVQDGDTLIFAQQEGLGSTNDGWNLFTETFGDEPVSGLGYDTDGYDNLIVIPGYLESLGNPTVTNQRAGIWEVNVSTGGVVNLSFVRQILVGQVVTVKNETSKLFYDPLIQSGKTVPAYSLLSSQATSETDNTSFDGSGTRFASNRDNYTQPGTLDKYLKFPKTGVF
jgi:photosystem II stability/assembly factor-like uncharacterized protein